MTGLNDVQVHLVDSVDSASELMRWLSTKDIIAFDTESTGLDKDRDRVRLFQVGDERTGWAIPWERWGGVVDELVAKYQGRYVAHNLVFDLCMSKNDGVVIPPHKCDDTRLMMHTLDSIGSLALKNYARKNIDSRAAELQSNLDDALKKAGWSWDTVPVTFPPYWQYGGVDPILTMQAFNQLKPRVDAEAPASYQIELAAAMSCNKMERRGTMIDREYTLDFQNRMLEYIESAERWCKYEYNFKINSTDAIIQRLQRDGVNLTKLTPNGAKYSLDKFVLATIDHPLAQTVLARRRAEKIVSTYLSTYLRLSELDDGLIHPSINTVGGTDKNPFEPGGSGKGVRTGRMSMNDPNLQNVPIRTAVGAQIRNCFIPRPNHTWIKDDADQIEMRILAHLSKDPKMIEAFVSEGDFFVNLARDLFAEPDFQKSDPRRQLVKNGGYAKIYGAGLDTFAATAGAPLQEASDFMARFDALYSGVPRFTREVERVAQQRMNTEGEMYVRSPLTGRKHVADRNREYALVNYLIQGMAGELLKMKIVEADQAGLDEFMIFPVHDEIDLDVPNDQVSDVIATLNDVMNDDSVLSVPMTWSPAVGDRWGTAKDV